MIIIVSQFRKYEIDSSLRILHSIPKRSVVIEVKASFDLADHKILHKDKLFPTINKHLCNQILVNIDY